MLLSEVFSGSIYTLFPSVCGNMNMSRGNTKPGKNYFEFFFMKYNELLNHYGFHMQIEGINESLFAGIFSLIPNYINSL